MSKYSITLAWLLVTATPLANGNTFNGKTTGMADAGIATANHLEGMVLNPAALATFDDGDDFNLHINAGALITDEDDLLDNADALAEALDAIRNQVPTTQQVDEIIWQLEALDSKTASLEGGGGFYLNIPSNVTSLGLYGHSRISAGVIANVDNGDITLLEDAVDTLTPVDTDQFDSNIFAMGAMVTDIGITFAHKNGDIAYGITPKYQTLEIIEYQARVDNFDEDDFDAAEYTTEDSAFNMDIGMQQHAGPWRFGATLFDAIEREYESISGRKVKIESRLAVGTGYRNNWFTAALDVDTNATSNWATNVDSQFLRLGFAMDAAGWAQIRLGYKTDLESALDDTYTVGIGLSPFDIINLDVSAITGQNDTVGGAIQLGLSF